MLADGALRAVALLELVPSQGTVAQILDFAERHPPEHHLRYWPAVAAARWPGRRTRSYLKKCARGPREDVAESWTRPDPAARDGRRSTHRTLTPAEERRPDRCVSTGSTISC